MEHARNGPSGPVRFPGFAGRMAGLALLLVWLACVAPVEYHGRKVGGGLIFYTVQGEIAMGRKLAQQLDEAGVPYLQDPQVRDLIQQVATRLVAAVPETFPKYPFDFGVIDDCVVNAFAAPGGVIRLHRGLLTRLMSSEAEVAGVLAHEMGHVLGRHSAKQLSDTLLKLGLFMTMTAIVSAVEEGKCKDLDEGECRKPWTQVTLIAGVIGLRLAIAAYSRKQESEADWIGAHLMADAGYDPEAFARFMEKMADYKERQGVSEGSLMRILSTHPPSRERARHIRDIRRQRLAMTRNLIQNTPLFARVRRNFRSLPPPRYNNALASISCDLNERTCDERRETCHRQVMICAWYGDEEDQACANIKEQCKQLERECLEMEVQCRRYREWERRHRPQC